MSRFVFSTFLLWAILCGVAAAQSDRSPSAPTAPSASPSGEAAPSGEHDSGTPAAAEGDSNGHRLEQKPETQYLKDRHGNLVPVLDFPFEDFQRLYQIDQGLARPDRPPRFTLADLSIDGAAGPERAQLAVKITLTARDANWIRVPLRFSACVLRKEVQHEGEGEHFVVFDRDGYVSWIRAPANSEHTLSFELLVPLSRIGSDTRLRLDAPRAASSRLRLTVPLARATATVGRGAGLVTSKQLPEGRTEISVMGIGPGLELAWRRESAGGSDRAPTALEVYGTIAVNIAGPGTIGSQASLRVRSFGDPISSFRVRLPAGAKLVAGNQPGYTATVVDAPPPNAGEPNADKSDKSGADESDEGKGGEDAGHAQTVEVRLSEATAGPIDIRLATELEAADGDPEIAFEVGRFEVEKAVRQSGHISLVTAGDWLVQWTEGPRVYRVDKLPDALASENLVAGFEYFRQPCSLKVRVLPKESRVGVEPTYLLQVMGDEIVLDAGFKYKLRGAKTSFLEIDLLGWEVDSISPEGLVKSDSLVPEQVEPLVVPLSRASTGELELRIRARRDVDRGAANLSVPLPRPRVSTLAPSTVVVSAADNVELTPRLESMSQMTPETVPPDLTLPAWQQDPLCYRNRDDLGPSTFECDFAVHSQSVRVDVATEIDVQRRMAQVRQTHTYHVAYEAARRLTLLVPEAVGAAGGLEIRLDGHPLSTTSPPEESRSPTEGQPAQLRVKLPEARIGSFQLQTRYQVPLEEFEPGRLADVAIPLIMPEDGHVTSNTVRLSTFGSLEIQVPEDSAFDPIEEELPGTGHVETRYSCETAADAFEALAVLGPSRRNNATVIHKAWIQTWMTATDRYDRAVYALTSEEHHLRVALPEGAVSERAQVLLDGKRLTFQAPSQAPSSGVLTIEMPDPTDSGRHLLEIAYPLASRPPGGNMSLEAPTIEGTAWVWQLLWQVVTPGDEHLVDTPATMTSENVWAWQGWYWGRRPTRSQRQLEAWIGGARQRPPSPGENQYLFSTFGRQERIELATVSRRSFLFVVAGVTLLAGLLLLYFPVLRHPGALLIAGIVLAGVGLRYPVPALLIAQTAILGAVLTAAAWLLRGALIRRRFGRTIIRGTSGSGLHRGSDLVQPRREGSSQATTMAAPLPMTENAPDSNL